MKGIKKLAVVLLAGILAASVTVMAGCQKNDNSSSKSESSAASKADDKKDESKTDDKKDESKSDDKKDESKDESKADESKAEESTEASTEESTEAGAEESTEASAEGGEAADASAFVGDWVVSTVVKIDTKQTFTPDEYAKLTGADSALIITLSLDADGNAVFSNNGEAKQGTYTFDGKNLVVIEENGDQTKLEYNAETTLSL